MLLNKYFLYCVKFYITKGRSVKIIAPTTREKEENLSVRKTVFSSYSPKTELIALRYMLQANFF